MSFKTARRLLAGLTFAAAIIGATAIVLSAPSIRAASAAEASLGTPPGDAWLDALKGKHRELFDTPAPGGGIPLVHLMNYYDTYNKAYGVPDRDINGILTFYGTTTFHALNDATWAKYNLGEFLQLNDEKTGKPAVANPWRSAPVAMGMTIPAASIEAMQKRGATFIVCNNALTIFAGLVAQKQGLKADEVLADFKANILPGVTLVPGMVVAIEKAQGRGIAYHRQ